MHHPPPLRSSAAPASDGAKPPLSKTRGPAPAGEGGHSSLVMHVDIDAFFASVEQLRNPTLRGKPVAVGSGVIASCSYEARDFGLRNGMPLARAERLCPSLSVIRGHASIYRAYAAQLFQICEQWSPLIESHLDEAYCDLTGTDRLYPEPLSIGRDLKGTVTADLGLRVTVGLGRNRMFARMIGGLAKPDGLRRLTRDQEERFLIGRSIRDLPGIGRKRAEIFERLNIHTIGDLRELSRNALVALLGQDGASLFERARGHDDRAIHQREIPHSIQRGTSFEQDIDDPVEIDGMLEYLIERAGRHLRQRGLEAGGISVAVVYSDHRRNARSRRLPQPTFLDPELVTAALTLRHELLTRRVALRSIRVSLNRIGRASTFVQPELFPAAAPHTFKSLNEKLHQRHVGEEILDRSSPADRDRWTRLLNSLDRIRDRHGHGAILQGGALRWLSNGKNPGLEKDRHGLILRCSSLCR